MEYRFLGNSGLKVSCISLGNWVNNNTDDEQTQQITNQVVKQAWDLGINFFDTAEIYGFGIAEKQFGVALKALNVPRECLVISNKVWQGQTWQNDGSIKPNRIGTSTKRVREMVKVGLQRMQLDYFDVLFSHRKDYDSPIEEICKAFHQIIEDGFSFYWGTSMWSAAEVVEAIQICERLSLHKPICDQTQYNMLNREKFENEFGILFDKYKYGSTIWSPLYQGILTGKYNNGVPQDSRFGQEDKLSPMMAGIFKKLFVTEKDKTIKLLQELAQIAQEMGASQAQLAMAWCINNKNVSTAITGASKPEQLVDTCKAIEIYKKFTPEINSKLEKILGTLPDHGYDWKAWKPAEQRRNKVVLH